MPGGGDFCFAFRPGSRSFALKSCPGAGILTEKISGVGFSPGGGNRSNLYLHYTLPKMPHFRELSVINHRQNYLKFV